MNETILITGGTGYIGSHAVVAFQNNGYNVIILDNLHNSKESTIDNIEKITGIRPKFYNIDLTKPEQIDIIFKENKIDGVVHFAGLKAVGESCEKPFLYYKNNIAGSWNLLEKMLKYDVDKFIFSSSACVYNENNPLPYNEEGKISATNPYGTSKLVVENIARDLSSTKGLNAVNLRYFNPIGAHSSGLIGEDPNGIPNNLLPFVMDVAIGKREKLSVFGGDYNTIDGSGVRDYIHVIDLIDGHIAAYEYLCKNATDKGFIDYINLGTGNGTSVLEVIKITESVTGKKLPYQIVERRDGDLAEYYCDPTKAREKLGWTTQLSVKQAIADGWKFIQEI